MTAYRQLTDEIFVNFLTGIGLTGVLMYVLTQSIIPFKYSEAYSYSIIAVAMFGSFLLSMIFITRKSLGKDFSFYLKNMISTTFPVWFILIQLVTLIVLTSNYADYYYSNNTKPPFFNLMNHIIIIALIIQCMMYRSRMDKIKNDSMGNNIFMIPMFSIITIICLGSIAQLYVILNNLITDDSLEIN
tara:strand:- start:789 stop:1349 length:561 start_codon:yes stop_codon:yes gene_type:complete